MPIIYDSGERFTIEEVDSASISRTVATSQIPGNQSACVAQLDALIKRLAETGKLSNKDQFRHEGDQIYAIKARHGLRAYGWFHRKRRGVFVISHYVRKKQDRMLKADLVLAINNRDEYEAND